MKHLAISVKEFAQMFQSTCPPSGWGNLLAVAHSGGADSSCLLYLLHRLISEQKPAQGGPLGLLALSVDHSLQPGSAATAEHCRRFSESLQIPHVTLRIPWSCPPFPGLPETTRPFEGIARSARYRLLLQAMKDNKASVIAMGHHADDHVETLLMRLARNGSGFSPMGIRSCRRWGMGSHPDDLDWAGADGMSRWIVRPLLGVSKDRIFATCDLHGLSYVDDPTNFQPSLTPRNYVRHFLSKSSCVTTDANPAKYPVHSAANLTLDRAIHQLDAVATLLPGLPEKAPLTKRLHAAASHLGRLRDKVDEEVNQYLVNFTKPSPTSTLLLCPPTGICPPTDVRRAIVLRILRFVSPRPWGAPISEASRRSSSLDLISSRLWDSTLDSKKTFCAGSEVIWRPVSLRNDGRLRLAVDDCSPYQVRAWLASRQPPIKRTGASSPCVQDISRLLKLRGDEERFLWDNRFLLRLRPRLLPREVLDSCQSPGSVIVLPHGRWLLPEVVWCRGREEVVLGGLSDMPVTQHVDPEWIEFTYIRSLDEV